MAIVKSGLAAGTRWSFGTLVGRAFLANGIDRNQCYDGVVMTLMGIRPPSAAATFNANINGDLLIDGVYYYKYTYFNINKGTESDPSPMSAALSAGSAADTNGIRLDIPANGSVDTQVTHVRVYRTAAGGSVFYYDGEKAYTGAAITYDSVADDAALTTVMGELNASATGNTNVNGVPPSCPYILAAKHRIWAYGTVKYTAGTVTMANGSASVVGAGTAWTDGMVGKWFQISTDSRKYLILSVEGATALTLSQVYDGSSGGSLSYLIYGETSTLFYSYIDLNGNPQPESFPADYYIPVAPNSGDDGTGLWEVHNQIVISQRKHLFILSGNAPADFELQQMNSPVGFVSHFACALDDQGNLIGPSDNGIIVTDGNEVYSLSNDLIKNIFSGENDPPFTLEQSMIAYWHGVYDRLTKRYLLWVASSGSTYLDKCIVYDFNKVDGVPIGFTIFNVRASASGIVDDANGIPRVYFGDEQGFVKYFDEAATNDGAGMSVSQTRRGTATAATVNTLSDAAATFDTTGDGLKGVMVTILSGTGAGQSRMISSNTANQLTLYSNWSVTPDTTSVYGIGAIDAYWVSKDFEFGENTDSIFERVRMMFKTAVASTVMYLKRFINLQSSQSGTTKYFNVADASGDQQTRFEVNRARHHKIKIGICDVDKPVTVYQLNLEFSVHGKPDQPKEQGG